MSETASSPSVHLHPMSPSSSMSSTDSAPRSEPTSDEQPDLGAFTTVLREWTHLQPPPRIPVQIRSATSSTTPTFQPESILGHSSDFPAPSARSDRRLSGVSTMSSFTRPPSSSIRPDGSTVWAQAPIASYLFSQTPSNDIEEEGGYTPYSAVSSALTVEIASERDFPSFDEESSHLDFSPPSAVAVELASDTLRIDSRVTGHDDDENEVEIVSTKDESSHTSRDIRVRTLTASTSQDDMTSIQLQSQPRPITTTATSSSSSLPLLTVSSGAGVGQLQSQARPTTGSSSSSLPVPTGLSPPVPSTSSHSQPSSTTDPQPNLIPRSRNPIPPRTMSDSSYTTSGSAASSNLSLLSYQIPETPPEESEHERSTTSSLRPQVASSASLVTQRVPPSSSTSTSTYATQGQRPFHTSTASISSTGSPLPNPHSPLPTPSEVVAVEPHRPSLGMGLEHIVRDLSGVINDMGTPDQPPSETLLFDPPRTRRNEFEPIDDEEDEDVPTATGRAHGFGFGYTDRSLDQGSGYISGYDHHGGSGRNPRAYEPQHEDSDEEDHPSRHPYSHNQTPHHAFSHTPRGVPPPAEPQTFKLIPTTTSSFASQSTGQALQQPYGASSQTFSSSQPQHPLISNLIYQQQQQQQQQSQVPVQPQSLPVPPQSQPRASAQTHVVSQLQSSSTSNLTSAITSTFADKTATSTQPSTHSITSYPSPYTASSNLPIILESSHGHGYPRSLAGLHSLPTNLISPRSDTFSSSTSGSGTATAAGTGARTSLVSNFKDYPYVEPDSKTGTRSRAATIEDVENELPEMRFGAHLSEVAEEPHELPSLGYLDEALSFIAAERARWTAARESSSGQGGPGGSNGEGGEDGEADGDVGQMDEDWRHNLDFEQEHPKRKRRRKRPPRSHGPTSISIVGALETSAPPPSGDVPTTVDSTQQLATPHSSPKKKKRTKTGTIASSASASVHSLHLDSKDGAKTPGRGRSKGKEKEFLIAPTAAGSSVTGGVEKERSPVTILKRPVGSLLTNPVLSDDDGDSDDVGDGGRTPTNRLVGTLPLADGMTDGSSASPINLTGKKGKRVGRKEREREKIRFDAAKMLAATRSINETEGVFGEDTEFGVQYIDDDDDDDEDEEDDDDDEDDSFQQPEDDENDSISNMSLLKPPRKRRERSRRRKASKDTSHIHSLAGITGAAYKSTPATPRASTFADNVNETEESPSVEAGQEAQLPPANVQEGDVFASKPNEATGSEKERRKRSRPKRSKSLVHAKSEPQLKLDAETGPTEVAAADEVSLHGSTKWKKLKKKPDSGEGEDILEMDRSQLQQYLSASYNSQSGLLTNLRQTQNTQSQFPPESRRGRLLSLGRQLKQLFPEQREELGRVISRIERQGATQEGQGTKAKKAVGSDGVASGSHEAPVAPKSTPVSISGVKRKRSRRSHARTASEGANIDGFELDDDGPGDGHSGLNLDANEEDEEIDPRGRPPKKGDVLVHVFIDHSNILIGLLSHIKRNMYRKGLKVLNRGKPPPVLLTRATTANPASAFAAVKSTSTRPLPVPTGNGKSLNESPSKRSQPVPVLQPGSHPIPLPSFATVSRSLPTGSVLSKYMAGKNNGQSSDQEKDATSDGYEYPGTDDAEEDKVGDDSLFIEAWKVKKKKAPKHLWHAALAFILERGRPITRRVVVTSSPLYQPMESIERLGYELRVFIRVPDYGDGMDRERHKDKGAFKTNGGAKPTSPVNAVPFAGQKSAKGHTRRISGSTSAESGSGPGSGNASGGTSLHPYSGITNSITPQTKVKYREQGVDELLQLKLHQALAATDEVVEGSTIVLATGDGNMGQFNEDGFLGPVRTALRRGWKVELYAWEDGLSRAWKREFGDGSEWGRKDMFRVIAMEQFATWLVESVDWA